MVDDLKITVLARNEEDQECVDVMQGILNYKHDEIMKLVIDKIKEDIRNGEL